MWFASLLTSGATSFGRLLIVNLLPNAVPLVSLWFLLRAHSFSGQSDWSLVIPPDLKSDVLSVVLGVLTVALLAAIVQPFQIRVVRLLEGYWNTWAFTARIAPVFVEHQYRKITRLRDRLNELPALLDREIGFDTPLSEQARRQRERQKLRAEKARIQKKIARYPRRVEIHKPPPGEKAAKDVELLPTALGNALRAAEYSAGERYGLDTLTSWPRIYPLFSERFASAQAASRDSLDASTTLCVGFFVSAMLGAAALWDEPAAYWLPATALILSWLAYLGAVAAAVRYGGLIRVAYDLHRFDLLQAMHMRLPTTGEEEERQFKQLTAFLVADDDGEPAKGLAKKMLGDEQYDHLPPQPAPPEPSIPSWLARFWRS